MRFFSYIKYARRSMRYKLFGYMAMLAFMLILCLCIGLLLFGKLSSPKADTEKTLNLQMEVFMNDMTSLWRNVSVMGIHLSEDMTLYIEQELARQNISFDGLNGNIEAVESLQGAVIDPLHQYIEQTECSGAFIILNTTLSKSGLESSDSRSGLYIQKSNAEHLKGDMLLFRGMADVGRSHKVMPHRKWAQEFKVNSFPHYNYYASNKYSGPLYKMCRTTELITLPGTSEKAIMLTVPVIGSDGSFYGICGFSVNQTYFNAHHGQPSNLSSMACIISRYEHGVINADKGLLCSAVNGYCYVQKETFSLSPAGDGLFKMCGEDMSFICTVSELQLAAGDKHKHRLAVMIPEQDFNFILVQTWIRTIALFALIAFFAIVSSFYFSRSYIKPVLDDLEKMRHDDFDQPEDELTFEEFEAFSSELREKKLAHKEKLNLLEKERQTAQTNAERLAYSRKTEIDPAAYQQFLLGIKNLTAAERSIFEEFSAGTSVKELSQKSGRTESTLRTHLKNIYSKLDVHSAKQLRLYAALMRQELENSDSDGRN